MADQGDSADDGKLTIGRGPSYPFIDLSRALERVGEITSKGAERTKLAPETFYKLWGYAPKSSGARQTMAALNAYGLVEYVGKGNERRVQLTDLARRIALDKRPGSPDRQRALAQAAIEPPIFAELYDTYGPLLPDPTVMEFWLMSEKGFNQQGADAAIGNFMASVSYARIDKPAGKPDEEDSQEKPNMVSEPALVGDLIDWEANGVLRNAEPLKVRAVSDDGAWVFVEQSTTGIPMAEVIVKERASAPFPPQVAIDQAFGRMPAPPTLPLARAPQPVSTALDVNFDMKTVSVSGRTSSPEDLQAFIDDLLDLKPILAKRVAKDSAQE